LDYSLNRRGPIYFDLATILVDPQTRQAQILTGGRFLPAGFMQACRQSILDVYFSGEPYNEQILNFYCALAALNKWSADELDSSVRPNIGKRVFTRIIRHYYMQMVPQYL
jgi:hypothetical protein